MRLRRLAGLSRRRLTAETTPRRHNQVAAALLVCLTAACSGSGSGTASTANPSPEPSQMASALSTTSPASSTPSPETTNSPTSGEEPDRDALLRLIRQDDRILGVNAIAGDKFDPDFASSCTTTPPATFREAPAVVYFRCGKDNEPFVAAPARALSGKPGIHDVVTAVLAGPTPQERRSGFEATAARESSGFDAAVFEGTAVVNFRSPAPIGTNYPAEISPLVSSLNSLEEVSRVSLLVDRTPICEPEGCGPKR